MEIENLEKITLIYGENFSGKTKFLHNVYLDMNRIESIESEYIPLKTDNYAIYLPVNRIEIEKDKDFSVKLNEVDNIYDYQLQRKKEYKNNNLKVFTTNLINKNHEKVFNSLELFFDIKLDGITAHYSDGIISVLSIIAELEELESFEEGCLVLIDELDAYLYPKQQIEILSFLTEKYPKNNYIITTHSALLRKNIVDGLSEYKIKADHLKKMDVTARNDIDIANNQLFGIEQYNADLSEFSDNVFQIINGNPNVVSIENFIDEKNKISEKYPNEYFELEEYVEIAERLMYEEFC